MNKFYYLRHAQTDAHVQHKLCGGAWNLPLNDAGVFQAKEASALYAESLKDIQVIYSSPMQRAKQTADIFSEQFNLPIVIVDDLKEWDLGDWDKKPWHEIPDLFDRKDDPPNGESQKKFSDRVSESIRPLISATKVPLIISHGAVWYRLLDSLGVERQTIPACTIKSFHERNGQWLCE